MSQCNPGNEYREQEKEDTLPQRTQQIWIIMNNVANPIIKETIMKYKK